MAENNIGENKKRYSTVKRNCDCKEIVMRREEATVNLTAGNSMGALTWAVIHLEYTTHLLRASKEDVGRQDLETSQ